MAPNDDMTTIAITTDQRDALNDIADADESNYVVLQRLIDAYNPDADALDEARVREIAREEVRDAVVREALE